MKADKIFDSVMGLMFSEVSEKSDFEKIFYPTLNIILAECFEKNNILRRKKGLEVLTFIPEVSRAEDEIGYEEIMLRSIVPYGVAANLYCEEDENGITNVYREKYMMMLAEIGMAEFTEVEE